MSFRAAIMPAPRGLRALHGLRGEFERQLAAMQRKRRLRGSAFSAVDPKGSSPETAGQPASARSAFSAVNSKGSSPGASGSAASAPSAGSAVSSNGRSREAADSRLSRLRAFA